MASDLRLVPIRAPRGLNDRRPPVQLRPGESPLCLNMDLYRRVFEKRDGYELLTATPLKNAALRLDGRNDYLRITASTNYASGAGTARTPYVGFAVRLNVYPTAAVTIFSWGFGSAADLLMDIRYDPTAGTTSLGAWVLRYRDSNAGATRTLTLTDDRTTALGAYRFLEFYRTSTQIVFKMWTEAGVATTAAFGLPIGDVNYASTQDIFLGVGTTALNTIGSDFAGVTISDLRLNQSTENISTYDAASLATNFNWPEAYKRELPAASYLTTSGISIFSGYWKLNDGGGSARCEDLVYDNDALIVNQTPLWAQKADEPLVLGQAGVEFEGGTAWIEFSESSGTKLADTFTATAPNVSRWTVRGIYAPRLLPGQTTVQDGNLWWAGASATLPAPVALRVITNRFTALYNDGGATLTVTLNQAGDPTVTSLVGKRVRIAMAREGTGNGNLTIGLTVDNGDGTVTSYFRSTACAAASPTTVSSNWAIGRHVINFATARLGDATAFQADGELVGLFDDFQIIHTNVSNVGVTILTGAAAGSGTNQVPFTERSNWNVVGAIHTTHGYLKLNDGGGSFLKVEGTTTTDTNGGWRAYFRPDPDDGATWDAGLVDTEVPIKGAGVFDFGRFSATGAALRGLLAATGCTLSMWTEAEGLKIVGALPAKATAWTFAQYGQNVIIAGDNGRAPVIFDGALVRKLGIRAPSSAAVVTVSNAAGTFVNGAFYLYYTFRDRNTGIESNPSPPVVVTFAGADDTIDSVTLAISADPQVNQRVVYMTAVNGADGDTAYPVAYIDDNLTTAYTTDILTVSTSATPILEYFDHEDAPQASVVAQLLDFTVLGGNQLFPTRLYFSASGQPWYWGTLLTSSVPGFLDLDLDAGRRITALGPLLNRLIADVGDGKWGIYVTGDSERPLEKERINNTHGAVGPLASYVENNEQWYVGETGAYVSDGIRETKVSDPDEPPLTAPVYVQNQGLTSLKVFFRTRVNQSFREIFAACSHRVKQQQLFALRLTDAPDHVVATNSHVLVYDRVQAFWALWDIPLDCGTLAEVDGNVAEPVGVVQGRLAALDRAGQAGDGLTTVITTTVASVTDSLLTVTVASGVLAAVPRFTRVWFYRRSDDTIHERRIESIVSSTKMRLNAVVSTLVAGDPVVVGAFPFFFDLALNMGNPSAQKALKRLRYLGVATGATRLKIFHKGDIYETPTALTAWPNALQDVNTTQDSRFFALGGLGRTFYVRIADSGYASDDSISLFPGAFKVTIHNLEFAIEEKGGE